jgi:hypothetical protein
MHQGSDRWQERTAHHHRQTGSAPAPLQVAGPSQGRRIGQLRGYGKQMKVQVQALAVRAEMAPLEPLGGIPRETMMACC